MSVLALLALAACQASDGSHASSVSKTPNDVAAALIAGCLKTAPDFSNAGAVFEGLSIPVVEMNRAYFPADLTGSFDSNRCLVGLKGNSDIKVADAVLEALEENGIEIDRIHRFDNGPLTAGGSIQLEGATYELLVSRKANFGPSKIKMTIAGLAKK